MFELNNSSNESLYTQIVEQTKLAIAKGLLKDGDPMPSVRELSKTLLINTSTVSKAYKQLSELGIIETVPGTGTFISLDKSKINIEKEIMEEKLKELFIQCSFLKIDLDEIIKIYKDAIKELI